MNSPPSIKGAICAAGLALGFFTDGYNLLVYFLS